ncbi:hypothetical protein [Caulobacter segnis]|uniref:Uncharacterized protein n=1 Tax=Caulobacter segnis TaxID=88688 RepID=A0A2W5V9R9_9CAUL|nr:hypothetical protein [Caulobacter segnis]PZR36510.1 MAG: hypothetical protein DI526_03475 [Caulobacter segnis]
MDELEKRLAALELVVIELGAWLDPAAIDDAMRSIAAGIETGCDEEREIRRQALHLLQDARRRFEPPAAGVVIT